ncbi:Cys-tRNA(Pro)/Cys-tRNA(Cys) deacylase [Acetobacter oeni]|uniref:Cys-tRNA(Pro)/Cys-tRNA(Cys) deacylase n=1 Tax=Acetobacter oeni TaxID=304077 RepID=A0A511XK05_9PROT|nr:Cys-tRNA(Pro) deacylase [Acetobacter oeni]GBR07100.1 regulatory protein [Acetobacter oeni LMG 21952]GEN63276.1 Cys-tRNA(Pro)/Cys-tRNA(Cys) deacylase [Acetobacter oeni]
MEQGAVTTETNATKFLAEQNVPFSVHTYDYAPGGGLIGMQAASSIGEDTGNVLKTLIVEVDKKIPVCVVVPVDQKVNFKAVAALFEGRNARMMNPEKAHGITGYQSGGTSPFGSVTSVPVVLASQAMKRPYIYVNAGDRGLVVKLSPADAQKVTNAIVADIAAA